MENCMNKRDLAFKGNKQTNDIYIVLQGRKLHEYQQLVEIEEINPFNIYGYNNKMNVGYNTKQFGVADDDQDIDMDYN